MLVLILHTWCALGNQPLEEPTDFGTTEILKKGFKGNIYYLEEGTNKLPDFSKMTPVGTIYTEILDIPPRTYIPQVGLCHRNIFLDSDFSTKLTNCFNYMFSDVAYFP